MAEDQRRRHLRNPALVDPGGSYQRRQGADLFVTLLEVPVGSSTADGFSWSVTDGRLTVDLPDRLPVTSALVFRLPASGARPA